MSRGSSGTRLSLLEPRLGQAKGAGSAAQLGTALVAPTFLPLKTGWEQDALLFSVWELERDLRAVPGDVTASRLWRGWGPRSEQPHFPFYPSSADPKALPILSCSQAGWGSSPGSTNGDEQLSLSLGLETPLALVTAHVLGSPGRSGSLWCCSMKNVTVALGSTGH